MRHVLAIAVAGVLSAGVALQADVKTEERARVTFSGGLGRMMNMFGGRAARDGVVTTIAVKGDRKLSRTDDRGQIIGSQVVSTGVIRYPFRQLGLCAGVTDARYRTTTEVYPDSPRATSEQCNAAQVAAVRAAIDYALARG